MNQRRECQNAMMKRWPAADASVATCRRMKSARHVAHVAAMRPAASGGTTAAARRSTGVTERTASRAAGLQPVESLVRPVLLQQLVVRALLHDAAARHDHDPIGR